MPPRTGLARALSKLGHCSRSRAAEIIRAGRVTLRGRLCCDPEAPVLLGHDAIEIAGETVAETARIYLMLNKPRGLITTARDEQGRGTIFDCLTDLKHLHLSPVGRLDKASEGLLLLTNDNAWANHITAPESHLPKTYHVQVAAQVEPSFLPALQAGILDRGERLRLQQVSLLRHGTKNTWLEITLDEGRNRQIRRVMEAQGWEVLRLVRVAIGSLPLGPLAKGSWRDLTAAEIAAMASPSA
jgi:23S rRNA pseudouridine2605 synthase